MASADGAAHGDALQTETVYDIVILGGGPAALAQAVALYEHPAAPKNVLILEKNTAFSWRGADLPMGRSKMKTNLMQDLVTARDPKSHFTFVNYLWSTDNLVAYTNLGSVYPLREIFSMYLDWCAKQFEKLGWIKYGAEVLAVEGRESRGSINSFRVRYRDAVSNSMAYAFAKKVIVAPGMVKRIPETLRYPGSEQRVFHASDFAKAEPRLQQADAKVLQIAIVGANDEAVEALEKCMDLDRQVKVSLFTNGSSIQQTDSNPFAGNAILSSPTSAYETLSSQHGPGKSQPSVPPGLLADLYDKNYAQLIKPPTNDQSSFHIEQFGTVTSATTNSAGNVLLSHQSSGSGARTTHGPFDVILAAAGYTRGLHERLLEPLKGCFDDVRGAISVSAEYRLHLSRRKVESHAGVWVLDGFEKGDDDAFPYMALRAERVLRSVLAAERRVEKEKGSRDEGNNLVEHRAAL